MAKRPSRPKGGSTSKRSPSPSKKKSSEGEIAIIRGGSSGSARPSKPAAKKSSGGKSSGGKSSGGKSSGGKPSGGRASAGSASGTRTGGNRGGKFAKSSGRPGGSRPRPRPAAAAKRTSSKPVGTDARPPRLQKVLAAAGIASRRDCETWIVEGRVAIDGKVVTELGVRVDPHRQSIAVDGDLLPPPKSIYYIVNKPDGALSTNRDPWGRMRVIDLVPDGTRLFTVGRLDKASEGLMLVTNDGDLANRLAHPRYGIEKIYRVMVAGHPTSESLSTLRKGIHLAEGLVKVARLTVKSRQKQSTILEMVLTEGRNREIRRMAASIGHKVLALNRIALGSLRLGTMPPGSYRPLEDREIAALRRLVHQTPPTRSAPKAK